MLTAKEISSANTTASQIPFIPQNIGKININAVWNTNVLKKDIIAEISPLFNAVKKDDANITKTIKMEIILN